MRFAISCVKRANPAARRSGIAAAAAPFYAACEASARSLATRRIRSRWRACDRLSRAGAARRRRALSRRGYARRVPARVIAGPYRRHPPNRLALPGGAPTPCGHDAAVWPNAVSGKICATNRPLFPQPVRSSHAPKRSRHSWSRRCVLVRLQTKPCAAEFRVRTAQELAKP